METCPKNIKRFLWSRYEGRHQNEISNVKDWAFGKYEITYTCKLCGCYNREIGVSREQLIRLKLRDPEFRESYDPRKPQTNNAKGE